MSGARGAALVWCAFPDGDAAALAAKTLLDEKLIACANILPAIRSLFEWQGEREEATEALLDRAIGRLAEVHPYAEPAIVGWRCDAAHPATAAWLGALVR